MVNCLYLAQIAQIAKQIAPFCFTILKGINYMIASLCHLDTEDLLKNVLKKSNFSDLMGLSISNTLIIKRGIHEHARNDVNRKIFYLIVIMK